MSFKKCIYAEFRTPQSFKFPLSMTRNRRAMIRSVLFLLALASTWEFLTINLIAQNASVEISLVDQTDLKGEPNFDNNSILFDRRQFYWLDQDSLVYLNHRNLCHYNLKQKKLEWKIRYEGRVIDIDCFENQILVVFGNGTAKVLQASDGATTLDLTSDLVHSLLGTDEDELESPRDKEFPKPLRRGILLSNNRLALIEAELKYAPVGTVIDIKKKERISRFHIDRFVYFLNPVRTDKASAAKQNSKLIKSAEANLICTVNIDLIVSIRDVSNDAEHYVSPKNPNRGSNLSVRDGYMYYLPHYCPEQNLLILMKTGCFLKSEIQVHNLSARNKPIVKMEGSREFAVCFPRSMIAIANDKKLWIRSLDGDLLGELKTQTGFNEIKWSPDGSMIAGINGSKLMIFNVSNPSR